MSLVACVSLRDSDLNRRRRPRPWLPGGKRTPARRAPDGFKAAPKLLGARSRGPEHGGSGPPGSLLSFQASSEARVQACRGLGSRQSSEDCGEEKAGEACRGRWPGEASGWHPQHREADMKGCAHRAAGRRRRGRGPRDSGAPGQGGPAADAPAAAGKQDVTKSIFPKDQELPSSRRLKSARRPSRWDLVSVAGFSVITVSADHLDVPCDSCPR